IPCARAPPAAAMMSALANRRLATGRRDGSIEASEIFQHEPGLLRGEAGEGIPCRVRNPGTRPGGARCERRRCADAIARRGPRTAILFVRFPAGPRTAGRGTGLRE